MHLLKKIFLTNLWFHYHLRKLIFFLISFNTHSILKILQLNLTFLLHFQMFPGMRYARLTCSYLTITNFSYKPWFLGEPDFLVGKLGILVAAGESLYLGPFQYAQIHLKILNLFSSKHFVPNILFYNNIAMFSFLSYDIQKTVFKSLN